jgi:hypothetical protein
LAFLSVSVLIAAQTAVPGPRHARLLRAGQDTHLSAEVPPPSEAEEAEVYNLEHGFGEALVHKDKNFLAEHLADDLIVVGWNGLVFTKDKLLGVIGYVDVSQYEISNVKFRPLDRDAILLTYDLELNANAAGKSAPSREYASSVWIKRDGRWIMKMHQSTPANHH